MIWPGAPYAWGAKVKFNCYAGDKLIGPSEITCYPKRIINDTDVRVGTKRLGYFDEKAPTCQFSGGVAVKVSAVLTMVSWVYIAVSVMDASDVFIKGLTVFIITLSVEVPAVLTLAMVNFVIG